MNYKNNYAPILKGKLGEFKALQSLSQTKIKNITPIIEVPPIDWDFAENEPKIGIDKHFNKFFSKIIKYVSPNLLFYLDCGLLGNSSDKVFMMKNCFEKFHEYNLNSTPVINLSDDYIFINTVKDITNIVNRVCIRLTDDFIFRDNINEQLEGFISILNLEKKDVDLIIDLEYFQDNQMSAYYKLSKDSLSMLSNLSEYSKVILSMTSFPVNLSGMGSNTENLIQRYEWEIWKNLIKDPSVDFKPVFSDYVISNPELTSVDPRIMQMSASIRYTTDKEWLILKGQSTKKKGFGQFKNLCKHLIENTEVYYGNDYSHGDNLIYKKAYTDDGPGNATTWRMIATNHHLEVVVNQLLSNSYDS